MTTKLMEELVSDHDQDELKKAMKEALKEWLDDKFITFGKWSLMSVAAMGLAALIYLILWSQGWQKLP